MAARSTLKVYWWNEEPNFGDAMTPVLLSRLFRLEIAWAPLEQAELTATGSVIQWITPVRTDPCTPIHVWGSGYIFPDEPPPLPGAVIYHAVRGPESARLSGLAGDVVYGDPGLLASRVFERRPVNHKVGIVAHLRHRNDPLIAHVAARRGVKFIDVMADPETVILAIASCEFILSSSLHGLIIADSFRIPNLWINLFPQPFGGRWKFDDYYGSFGLSLDPVELTKDFDIKNHVSNVRDTYERPGIDETAARLLEAFPFA